MDKKERKIIFDKCNGRCAYCGCDLKKGWHVSSITLPQTIITTTGSFERTGDEIENKLPACPSCSLSRTRDNSGVTFISIEEFRKQIEYNLEFLKGFAYYHRAIRFGQIIETGKSVEFYFETLKQVNQ